MFFLLRTFVLFSTSLCHFNPDSSGLTFTFSVLFSLLTLSPASSSFSFPKRERAVPHTISKHFIFHTFIYSLINNNGNTSNKYKHIKFLNSFLSLPLGRFVGPFLYYKIQHIRQRVFIPDRHFTFVIHN